MGDGDEIWDGQLGAAFEFFRYPKPWKKKFAYVPTKVAGNRVWLKTYYQRINIRDDAYGNRNEFIERGTIFDLLKD